MEFKEGQTVIFEIDAYNDGDIAEYDGYITYVGEDYIDVNYLYGLKSLNDNVKFENIVALVDETMKCEYYKTKSFSGHLIPNPLYKGSR